MSGVPKQQKSPPASRGRDDDDSDDDGSSKPKKGGSSSSSSSGPYVVDAKGKDYVAQAEKKLKSFTISFISGNAKFEEAIELFDKAAAQFKMAKNWQEAGEIYVRIAEINHHPLKELHEEGTAWDNAAKAFKNCNTVEAIRCFTKAVEILMENNKFAMAAKTWKEIGLIHEKDMRINEAMQAFQKAAECFEAENSAANGNAMWIKVAQLAADNQPPDYNKAISIYEKVSKASLEGSARWSVKDYLFKALLCHLALHSKSHQLDPVTDKLSEYVDMCPSIDQTREKQLIEDLIQDFNDNEPDRFADHVFQFDQIIKLDNWTAKVLLSIKQALEAGGPDAAVGV